MGRRVVQYSGAENGVSLEHPVTHDAEPDDGRPAADGHRVMVIGLDGAGFDVIGGLLAGGRMPNLARLQETGASGTLRSIYPPISAIAWPSFYTGVGPGKHTVFGFSHFHPATYGRTLANARSVAVPTIWDLASARERRSVIANVPMTYPPAPLNGVLVSGLLAPHPRSSFTYPEELRDELAAEVGTLMPDPSRTRLLRRTVRGALGWLGRATDIRTRMFLHLMGGQPWDLFVGVFRTTDVTQHAFLGKAVRSPEPPYEMVRRGGHIIAGHYEQVDAAIGKLVAEAPADTSFVVMSDHGANVKGHSFFTNEWLADRGLLKWARWPLFGESGGAVKHVTVGRQLQSLRVAWLGKLLPQHWLDREITIPRESSILHMGRSIDWAQTRAFCDPTMPEGIRINLRDRERDGTVAPGEEYERVVSDIIEAAGETAAADGAEPIVKIARREELYTGPHVEEAPDLVLITEDMSVRREPCRRGHLRPARGLLRAGHSSDGIVVASGPAFASLEEPVNASIVDLAPTILYLLGVPVPEESDGRVLTELLRPEVTAGREIEYAAYGEGVERCAPEPTEPVDERVVKRLRDLGYL